MDGLLFLWLLWAGWIISTFFWGKTNQWRFPVSACLLILIISFPFGIRFFYFQAGMAAVLIFIYSLLFIKEFSLSEKLYLLISSIIVSISYSSFQLLSVYDPVIVIVDKKIMLTVILVVLSFLLYGDLKNYRKRMLCLIIGLITGEFLTGIVFLQKKLPYEIGGHLFLDVLSIIVVSGLASHLIQLVSASQSILFKSAIKKGEVKNI